MQVDVRSIPKNHITLHKATAIIALLFAGTLLVAAFLAGFESGHRFGYWDRDFELRKVKGDIKLKNPKSAYQQYEIAGASDEGYRRVFSK